MRPVGARGAAIPYPEIIATSSSEVPSWTSPRAASSLARGDRPWQRLATRPLMAPSLAAFPR
eukprot:5236946-Pyramimonas_sp.AAC.1